ncbi:hypothetical protein GOP47_0015563 [Adiantum capillus-veneris]|uniref:F-box domain-containing protein n=1 Tax=Adiantum capillus-veneris TaxID=13818 RepID=A0A9D4ZCR5_ADICA|nr:hypothetical protein GOP47_0015563 [Adiantum capillus-veneris]
MGQGASTMSCISAQPDDDAELNESNQDTVHQQMPQFPHVAEKDYTAWLPDECLAFMFQKLGTLDRNQCSLVCKRWHVVEAQGRQRLALVAHADVVPYLPSIFTRFDHITKLALRGDRKVLGISDKGLFLIGHHCTHLVKLKMKGCKEITDDGIDLFARASGATLRKLACGSCNFGARGVNSIVKHCSALEDLTLKRLRGLGSKNLHTLMICRNPGNWDKLLDIITEHVHGLVELHMERLQISDRGLQAVSRCSRLEVLFVVRTPDCTNYGLSAIAEGCKQLKKLHIDGWKLSQTGDEGLSALATKCRELQELVLIGINATAASLDLMASNCLSLERLAICNSESVGDLELSCIAAKCRALRKLCIKGCSISDQGMRGLAHGCPRLIKVKVKKCRGITWQSAVWLQVHRPPLVLSLDCEAPETPDILGESEESFEDVQEVVIIWRVMTPSCAAADNLPSNATLEVSDFSVAGQVLAYSFVSCEKGRERPIATLSMDTWLVVFGPQSKDVA